MSTAAAAQTLPSFDVFALARDPQPLTCAYACPNDEEIRAEVAVDEDQQLVFRIAACPESIGPERAQQLLRACFRGPRPFGLTMRAAAYRRLRQDLAEGRAWLPRG